MSEKPPQNIKKAEAAVETKIDLPDLVKESIEVFVNSLEVIDFESQEFKNLLNRQMGNLQDWSENFSGSSRGVNLAKATLFLYKSLYDVSDKSNDALNKRISSNIDDSIEALHDLSDHLPGFQDEISDFIDSVIG